MLGNQVELWQVMLAVMKLGAATIPTTPAVGPPPTWLTASVAAARACLLLCTADCVADADQLRPQPWSTRGRLYT